MLADTGQGIAWNTAPGSVVENSSMKHAAPVLSLCLALTVVGPASRAHAAPPPPAAEKLRPDLFLAIGRQDADAVKALLAQGADPNARNTIQMTALMIAAKTGSVEVVNALLAAGAEVNAPSPFGSALTFAGFDSKPEMMRLLLDKGADVSASRPDRISILMLAARAGNAAMVRQLLARKADLAATDSQGSTSLSYAARAGKTEAARVLLDAGAAVDAADAEGWTPLMHAAVNGHAAVAGLLVNKGASLKAKDKKGRTALLLAASYGDYPELARVLLDGGAETGATDAKGRTALALAEARGYEESVKLLREKHAPGASGVSSVLRTPRQAAEAGLRQVEQSMQLFAKRTGCVSCHHQGIAQFTTGFARAHGFAINEALAQEQGKRVLAAVEEIHPQLHQAAQDASEIKNVPIVDVGDYASTYGTLFLGLAEHKQPPSESLADAALVLARMQTPEGDWRFGLYREPVQSSFFTMTALAVRGMRTYAPKQHAAEIEQRVVRAKEWLLTAPTAGTEDRAFRLLGLKWAGATVEERRKALAELSATQRPDGGWAQLPSLKSDAYATGSVLFALNQGGDVPVTDPAYQRGIRFLLRTQEDDGTWYVYKRAIPGNNYFDTGFPYGQSQYVSHAAACWATLALILAEGPGAQQTFAH
jgi:ankyrin repeat protein